MKVTFDMKMDTDQLFKLLLESLHIELNENLPEFIIEDGGIIVKDIDDRGELYLALYHLATKIFPNTEFRKEFEDPNTLMCKLYKEKNKEEVK